MKKEYFIIAGILFILMVVVVIAISMNKQSSGKIVIQYTDSGTKRLNSYQTYNWKTYYLLWTGESTTISISGEIWGSRSLHVVNGDTFSVYATDSFPVTIAYDGQTIQFTS